jgi:hypothetical protein
MDSDPDSDPDPDQDPDPDADPVIFVSDLQGVNKKLNFFKVFFACYFLKVHTFTSFFKDKKS